MPEADQSVRVGKGVDVFNKMINKIIQSVNINNRESVINIERLNNIIMEAIDN